MFLIRFAKANKHQLVGPVRERMSTIIMIHEEQSKVLYLFNFYAAFKIYYST